jgi:hypothetical protein
MREISPAHNATAEEFLRSAPKAAQDLASQIRKQKKDGNRPRPSDQILDSSILLTKTLRSQLMDQVASLVDENLFGRAEMCMQFADLLQRALSRFNLPARSVMGTCIYFNGSSREIFRWQHAWVRVMDEVIDGNVDCLFENPTVPANVKVAPYWGPITKVPADRRLRESHGTRLPPDDDVSNVWWPDLAIWLDQNFAGAMTARS